jgi:hypothetical protein
MAYMKDSTGRRLDSFAVAPAPVGQFELQPIWVTGHSWFGNNVNATPGARFFERVQKRLGMGTITNKGVSGRTAGDMANLTLSGANSWTLRSKALAMLMCTINDATLFDGSAAARRHYSHAWRSMLATITANGAVAANTTSFVYSSGWTTEAVSGTSASPQAATVNSTGGTRWTTSTTGNYFEFTFTGTDVDVFLVARTAGAGLVTFTEGGTARGTLDLTATMGQDTPAVHKIRGLTAGTHTIRGTLTSGASLTVDSYRIPSTAPVPILVLGEPQVIPAEGDQGTYLADVELLKTDLAVVVAEYPSAKYLDLNAESGWNTATMLVSDGKHPHDWGSSWIADKVLDKLAEFPYSTGLNVLAASYPSAYSIPAGPAIPSGGKDGTGGITMTTVATDDFNRADSTDLGTTPVGSKAWSILLGTGVTAGTAGISTNRALIQSRTATSGWVVASIDSGATNHRVTAKIATGPSNLHALIFSAVDANNFMYVHADASGGGWTIKRVAAGAVVTGETVTPGGTPVSGDLIDVEINGTTVTVRINGTVIHSATWANRPMGSKAGFGQATSSAFTALWDDLTLSIPA